MGEVRTSKARFVAVIAAAMLALTACGARLTNEQRAAGIGLTGGSDGGTTPEGTSTTGPGLGNEPGVTPTGPGGGPTTGPFPSTAPSAPPGGNGGATDIGVTATKLTIGTVADVSGVQPGLFKSAHQAMQAYVAMINSQGGVDGRLVELLLLDSKVDAGGTRRAVLEACPRAFAIVGSMSAFDNGGAEPADNCKDKFGQVTGLPDLTVSTTTTARINARGTYPVYPNRLDLFIRGSGEYMAKKFGEASKHAAQLWLNTAITRSNAEAKRKAYISAGFVFDNENLFETQVVETNYTPYVQKMKDNGVRFVTMLSDWQSIARLTEAMRKEGWYPEVMEWDSVVYSPKFLQQTQGAAEGSYVYLNTALLEEIDKNPEMQLYAQWLARVAPGVPPDYFGLYAWSAGKLFFEQLKKIGPRITRAKLLEALRNVHAWDGNGLHAAHDIGNKTPSRCTMFVQIKNNKFVRSYPSSGFNCSGSLYRAP